MKPGSQDTRATENPLTSGPIYRATAGLIDWGEKLKTSDRRWGARALATAVILLMLLRVDGVVLAQLSDNDEPATSLAPATQADELSEPDSDPWILELVNSGVTKFVLGAVFGFLLNEILKSVMTRTADKYRRARTSSRLPSSLSEYEPLDDGIISLFEWSPTRPLTNQRLITAVDLEGPPRCHLLAGPEYEQLAADLTARGYAGSNVHICGIEPDYRESERSQYFKVHIVRTEYAEAIAGQKLLTASVALQERLREAASTSMDELLRIVPPTTTSANLLVISAEGNALVARRSMTVALFAGEWGFGVNESMKFRDDSGEIETFFDTIERGMHEELGLAPEDYHQPFITRLNYSLPAAAFGFNAIVRLKSNLSEKMVEESARNSHSSYEHDVFRWLPISRQIVDDLVRTGSVPGVEGKWIYFARSSLRDLWRFRNAR